MLVIRGELLKKYPTAVIYAHRAEWAARRRTARIDQAKARELVDAHRRPRRRTRRATIVQTPLYEAKVEPDIYFFGFDLTAEEARGGTGENGDDDPGWFFVIKERPGEPRFGFDIERTGAAADVWNDLAWADVARPAASPARTYRRARARPIDAHRAGRRATTRRSTSTRGRPAGRWRADMSAAGWPTSSTRRRCWSRCTPPRCCRGGADDGRVRRRSASSSAAARAERDEARPARLRQARERARAVAARAGARRPDARRPTTPLAPSSPSSAGRAAAAR